MRNLLFLICLAYSFASAATCTELYFAAQTWVHLESEANILPDSSYFVEKFSSATKPNNEWTHKYHWSNGNLDSIVIDFKKEGVAPRVQRFYKRTDVSEVIGKDNEIILNKSTSGDTIIYDQTMFTDGEQSSIDFIKIAPEFAEFRSNDKDLDRLYFSGDTLVHEMIFNYNTDKESYDYSFIVPEPTNPKKCLEYMVSSRNSSIENPDYTYETFDTEKGYLLKVEASKGTYDRDFYFIDNLKQGTTSLQKRATSKVISPKVRYFDFLGRYRYAK